MPAPDISVGLRIHRVTLLCQLQDLGRTGYQRYGVNRSGAMDPFRLKLANVLAGNPLDTPCLEFALAGAIFEVACPSVRVSFVGDFPVLINGENQPPNATHYLETGDRLEIGATRGGSHGYLAVSGGFSVEAQLGSCSTHLRSGLGGFDLPMTPGTVLPVKRSSAEPAVERYIPDRIFEPFDGNIRAIAGPQFDHFSRKGQQDFFSRPFQVGRTIDRMGYRLEGPAIEHALDANIISEPVLPGCVQVPADGMPIVLMADCGTVGGYPKIATVISTDLGKLAQLQPGASFHFEQVTVETAQENLRHQRELLKQLQSSMSAENGL